MALNVRRRRYLGRLAGYAVNPLRTRLRTMVGRDQRYSIGGQPVVLPPAHQLPFYQRRDPTYDSYADTLVRRIASISGHVHVVDLGANVGDTAVGVLEAHPGVSVTCVEGDVGFLTYLHTNTSGYGDRVQVVEGFVGPVGNRRHYRRAGGTGGFQGGTAQDQAPVEEWIRPAELLASVPRDRTLVWKSDIDGFDIHVLAEHWERISSACDVLWFEYDPVATLGDRADVGRLIDLLADSGRVVHAYDNLGRRLVTLEAGVPVRTGLQSLTSWLHQQRHGHVTVPYLDLWAVTPTLAAALAEPTG